MNSDIKNLLDLIGAKEAPRGYDQMYWRAERALGRHKLTAMTLDQVKALQQKMVTYGSTACGKYQFIRATFDATRNALGLPGDTVWTPEVQDNMAVYLLNKRGLTRFIAGQISREDFANNLAKEWASLPVVTHIQGATLKLTPGQSYYSGDGLNKSFHTPKQILTAIDALHAQPVVVVPAPAPESIPIPAVDEVVKRWAVTAVAIVIILSVLLAIYYVWQ